MPHHPSQDALDALVMATRASRDAYRDAAALLGALQRQHAGARGDTATRGSEGATEGASDRAYSEAFVRLLEAILESRRAYLIARSLAGKLLDGPDSLALGAMVPRRAVSDSSAAATASRDRRASPGARRSRPRATARDLVLDPIRSTQ